TVGLASDNPAEGSVSPASLTFTPDNWNVPQTVTVTGIDDQAVDGDVAYSILTTPAASADPGYHQLNPPDVAVVNQDDDTLDLRISDLRVEPADELHAGADLVIRWTVGNGGSVPTPRSFAALAVITNATTGEPLAAATLLRDGPHLPAGAAAERQFTVNLSDGPRGAGPIQFTVITDHLGQVFEDNAAGTAEANNTASVTLPSDLGPYPDLQVANLRLDPPAALQSGDRVVVR